MEENSQPTEVDAGQAPSGPGHQGAYSTRHPVPTVQHYKQVQQERDNLVESNDQEQDHEQDHGRKRDGLKKILGLKSDSNEGDPEARGWADQGYNRNQAATGAEGQAGDAGDEGARSSGGPDRSPDDQAVDSKDGDGDDSAADDMPVDTSEAVSDGTDPRQKRKAMKGRAPEKDKKSRKVTDPITHLPVTIHDFTSKELNDAPANLPPFGSQPRTATGINAASKDEKQLKSEEEEIEEGTMGMQSLFPPPSLDALKADIGGVYVVALSSCAAVVGIVMVLALGTAFWLTNQRERSSRSLQLVAAGVLLGGTTVSALATWTCNSWLTSKVNSIWQDDIWDASRQQERKAQRKLQMPESAMWLNSLIAGIWPLINPDLFSSMVDTLEDVMQASLPKLVRMIAIEDFGQGKSSLRILGVRWLPSGAAAKSVTEDGEVKPRNQGKSDREDPNRGQIENSDDSGKSQDDKGSKSKQSEDTSIAEGMEGESGDFLNMELSFSYRATAKGKSLKHKTENAHMYLVFYLPASKHSFEDGIQRLTVSKTSRYRFG